MGTEDVREMLIDIPAKVCRTMSYQFIDAILKERATGVSQHHFMILKLLGEHRDLYVSEVVDCLGIPRPQMTASTNKLVDLGYIARSTDATDRRKINLSLTPKGRSFVDGIVGAVRMKVDDLLSALSVDQAKALEAGLRILLSLCSLCREADDGVGV